MRDDEAPAVPEERDDVVAQLRVGMSRRVRVAEANQAIALRAVHCFVPFPRAKRLPRFHLGDDERRAAPQDEIDLAGMQPFVARDNAIAAEAVEPCGSSFAALAEEGGREFLRCEEAHRLRGSLAHRVPRLVL